MPWKPPPRAGATVLIWAGYSLAERDRRWRAVRENAARAGLDCIFVPLGDGVVNHTAFAEVMHRLPNARFEDATDVVGFVRYIKSEEEVSFVKQAVKIAEAGIDEMIKAAQT